MKTRIGPRIICNPITFFSQTHPLPCRAATIGLGFGSLSWLDFPTDANSESHTRIPDYDQDRREGPAYCSQTVPRRSWVGKWCALCGLAPRGWSHPSAGTAAL